MRRPICTTLALLILAAAPAAGGDLAPELSRRMEMAGPDETIKALVVLRDRVDLKALERGLERERAGRSERHRRVIGELRAAAARSQRPLLARLEGMRDEGSVAGWTPHWIVNAVVVRATAAGLLELAGRGDVERIEPDLPAAGFEPVAEEPADIGQLGIGVTPGIRAINADRVWYELGLTGAGALVGIIDTGVDGGHPALRDRWRGNSAPADECWLDVAGMGRDEPVDESRHGTHIMGTIAGQAPNDSIGVAPGAMWIASNATAPGITEDFDSDIILSLEWFADPDGDPATIDDVPDVVQNSWGVHPEMIGVSYPSCYSYWWDAIDACEAAGVVLLWAAGNEGPDPYSSRSPADRATTAGNCFSVGSVNLSDPLEISYFSSRGPSPCDSVSIKPEVVAPGHPIYSSVPGDGYYYFSGTSMAGPHAAGVVALMRGLDPDLDVDSVKRILTETAVDMGDPGEDNDYGHGLVDAMAAVMAVMGPAGAASGRITDQATGEPVPGATVTAGTQQVRADAQGRYSIVLAEGMREIEFSGFGYAPALLTVGIYPDAAVNLDAALTMGPRAVVGGTVRDPDGLPVDGAVVTALDTPVEPAGAGADGAYSLLLPPGGVYRLQAVAAGLGARVVSVAVEGDTTVDFILPRSVENFETGGFDLFPWTTSGDAVWEITDIDPAEGAFCARSGPLANGQESILSLTETFAAADTLSFELRVSSEDSFDALTFLVDGEEIASWSGELPWHRESFFLQEGEHTLQWRYVKDASGSGGGDTAWLDLIRFPAIGEPPRPRASLSPAMIDVDLQPEGTARLILTLENGGQADLQYAAAVEITGPAAGGPEPATPAGRGGPDAFGYWWIDSDAYQGPTYDWVEISGLGTPIDFPLSSPDEVDDDTSAPIPLGFSFPFYGNQWEQVRVCTNGFLSFSSTSSLYKNYSIPNTSTPNDLIAPMWSDLRVGFWTGAEGPVYTWSDPAGGRFVVQYSNAKHLDSGQKVDFQVILEDDGDILCQYANVPIPPESAFYTVGIENSTGMIGLEAAFNEPYLRDGLAVLFTTDPPAEPWLAVSPASGSVPPLSSAELALDFDAADLEPGAYTASIILSTNDPVSPEISIPVQMIVDPATAVGDPAPARFILGSAAPNPFNPSTAIAYEAPAGGGTVSLKIYDASGAVVRTLVSGHVPGGSRSARWDGRDDSGRSLASGVYFVRFLAPGAAETRKIALVR